MRRHSGVLLISAALLLLASVALGEDIEKDYHEEFDVEPGHRLHLVHGDGDVTITPWDQDVLDVQVRYRATVKKIGFGRSPSFEVEFDQDGRTVHVVGREEGGVTIGSLSWNEHEYIYIIRAPEYLVLDLNGDDGDVEIEDWRGDIECQLDDGNIELVDVRNKITSISLEDGDLLIQGLSGDLDVDLEDGEVEISDLSSDNCRVVAEDGDIEIEDSEGNFTLGTEDGEIIVKNTLAEEMEVSASDGDIEIELRQTADLDLHAESEDGDITVIVEDGTSASFTIDVDDGDIRL
ncbi:MAG: DUF4097 family beta strand repeat-containing protein, partial [bacterium]